MEKAKKTRKICGFDAGVSPWGTAGLAGDPEHVHKRSQRSPRRRFFFFSQENTPQPTNQPPPHHQLLATLSSWFANPSEVRGGSRDGKGRLSQRRRRRRRKFSLDVGWLVLRRKGFKSV